MKLKALVLFALISFGLVDEIAYAENENTLNAEEQKAGWRLLFDGRSTAGWRGYKSKTVPASWRVENGLLLSRRVQGQSSGDLITVDEFDNFELLLQWKMTKGNNSGVVFRATEQHDQVWQSGLIMLLRSTNRRGGFDGCSIALFGEPGTGKFEFVLTGRHVTRRCDGDSVAGAAFGGPIFYGHAAEGFNEKPDHPGNVYWYQAKRANELFQALDGKQRKLALRSDARPEARAKTVELRGKDAELHGVPMSELTADQKELARKVMAEVLAPFRKADVDECMKLIKAQFDNLHFAYYQNMDIGDDGVWDVWQIEGPTMVWYFRGSPHVHTWVNIRETA
jgi:hypothetical protein